MSFSKKFSVSRKYLSFRQKGSLNFSVFGAKNPAGGAAVRDLTSAIHGWFSEVQNQYFDLNAFLKWIRFIFFDSG